ncbi:MAG: hypothetical protein ACLTYW_01265 [Collinsella sp.]
MGSESRCWPASYYHDSRWCSGDSIASILSENHIVENPKDYYAAVKKLNADMSLKPGKYSFTTLWTRPRSFSSSWKAPTRAPMR